MTIWRQGTRRGRAGAEGGPHFMAAPLALTRFSVPRMPPPRMKRRRAAGCYRRGDFATVPSPQIRAARIPCLSPSPLTASAACAKLSLPFLPFIPYITHCPGGTIVLRNHVSPFLLILFDSRSSLAPQISIFPPDTALSTRTITSCPHPLPRSCFRTMSETWTIGLDEQIFPSLARRHLAPPTHGHGGG